MPKKNDKIKKQAIDVIITLAENIKSVEIGDYDIWIKYSDHVPVSVTFNNKKRRRANA